MPSHASELEAARNFFGVCELSGPNVMILKIFLTKNGVFAQNIVQKLNHSIRYKRLKEKRQFFGENWRKSPKLVIIALISGG
jgi:hypothetical protein